MKTKQLITKGILLFVGLISATFAGPNWRMAIAAWLTPLFLIRYVRNTKTAGFFLFWGLSIIVNAINHSCFALVDLFIIHLINGIFYGTLFCIPYLIDRLIYNKNNNFFHTLIFPSAIVITEYLFSLVYGTWGTIAITQFSLVQINQLVSVTGIFGVSFIVAWFGSVINWVIENKFSKSTIKRSAIIYGSIFTLVFIYGDSRITFQANPNNTVKVAALSCDINIHDIFSEEYETFTKYTQGLISEIPNRLYTSNELVNKQLERTVIAAENNAKIIVWNEISLILNSNQVDSVKFHIQKIAKKNNVYVLIAYLEENTTTQPKPFNNKSVLIKPDGSIAWEYKKSKPHPQAEAPITNIGNLKIPFIDTPYGRIGNVICYDLDFPNYLKQAAKNNIDIMMVPSYDWEKITPFHSNMANFSAIENGFSIIRANGTGLSTIVDNYGITLSQLNTFTTNNTIVYANISTKAPPTLYSKIGNLLIYLCMLILIVATALKWIKTK